jgi:hypothetical protein
MDVQPAADPAAVIAAAASSNGGPIENIPGPVVAMLQQLTPAQQQQVLDFVEFLVQQNLPLPSAQSIWQKIDDRLAAVPDDAWEAVPTDGSYQHDHYLYGTLKRA